MRETILFFLIVVINGLTWIVSNIDLDMCAKGRWRVEVINNIQKYYSASHCVISIIIVFAPTYILKYILFKF